MAQVWADRSDNSYLATWALRLGLVVGAFMVFFVPPSQGLDEPAHFFRATSIVEGDVRTDEVGGRFGAELSACADLFMNENLARAGVATAMPRPPYADPSGCEALPARFVPFEGSAVYPPTAYLPATIGIAVAKAAQVPVSGQFYFGRLCSLLAYLGLLYAALRTTPRGAGVLFVVGMFPISLFLAATFSTDGLLIGLVLLLVAVIMRLRVVAEGTFVSRSLLTALGGTLLALSGSKLGYGPVLSALVFLVPSRHFGSTLRAVTVRLAAMLVVLGLSGFWFAMVSDITLEPYFPDADPDLQRTYVLQNPLAFAEVMGRSLLTAPTQAFWMPGMVASLGNFRKAGTPIAPIAIAVIGFVQLAFALQNEWGSRRRLTTRAVVAAALPLAVAVAGVCMVMLGMYLSNTPIRSPIITQTQGRYFLPFLLMPLLTGQVLRSERASGVSPKALTAVSGVLCSWLVLKVLTFYY